MSIITLDFETQGIVVGSATPPKPIGVAIKYGHDKPKYYSFGATPVYSDHVLGHQNEEANIKLNLVMFSRAKEELTEIVESGCELLFHNAKFDLRVMKHYFGLKIEEYKRIHDTMLLLFLYDPNQKRLGLKESAERLLGIKPTDKLTLKKYMLDNQDFLGVKISTNEKKGNYYMKMLKYAPSAIVAEYACNDVEITYKLFQFLYPIIFE